MPGSLDGKSLAPVIRGEAKQVRDAIFLAYRTVQRAVRQGDWKLIRYPQVNKTQLFDLRDDPHETWDLAEARLRALVSACLFGSEFSQVRVERSVDGG